MKDRFGVGLIGVGSRGRELAETLIREEPTVGLELRALHNRTRSRAERARRELLDLRSGPGAAAAQPGGAAAERAAGRTTEPSDIVVHDTWQALIRDPTVDLILICTPQYAHLEPSLAALRAGKKVGLEKPLAHTLSDAIAIAGCEGETANPLIMSFTRRFERTWREAHRLVVEEEAIGPLRMILVRNVLPAHVYFHTWHRRLEWSGGALGDRMSHIFDVFGWFTGDAPASVHAFGGQAVFGPREDAPLRCRNCDRECPYRARAYEGNTATGDSADSGDTCVWQPGADITDHGVVNVLFRRGVKASLFWAIFGPEAEDQETMELVGESGRLRLTREPCEVDLISDFGATRQRLDLRSAETEGSHFGADRNYIRALDAFCRGDAPPVGAAEGLQAARMVEAAHRSIGNGGACIDMNGIEGG